MSAEQPRSQTFATTARGLTQLAQWLYRAWRYRRGQLESTSVYWRPVYAETSETTVHAILVNARHVKMVPGRKTDDRDSEWLAQLLECGLLRASFVPPPPIRDLRDLTRLRKTLIRERGHHVNRIEKTLEETAHIKVSGVVTDPDGQDRARDSPGAERAGSDDPVSTLRHTLKAYCGKSTWRSARHSRAASPRTTPFCSDSIGPHRGSGHPYRHAGCPDRRGHDAVGRGRTCGSPGGENRAVAGPSSS